MEENTGLFSRRPGKDFSRNSKLTLQKTVSILLAMQGKSISNELLDFFDFDPNTPSASAFVQARNKLAPNAIQTLFQRFVRECDVHGTYVSGCLLQMVPNFLFLKIKIHFILMQFMTFKIIFM